MEEESPDTPVCPRGLGGCYCGVDPYSRNYLRVLAYYTCSIEPDGLHWTSV